MSVVKKLGFLPILFVFLSGLRAQTTLSPYSTFGVGEFYGNALANTQGMAGVGVSHPQYFYANTQNPALLVYNSLYTVFHAGLVAERRVISADTLSESTKGGNLNYLVTAFPVVRGKWSTSLSLSPYSTVKYNLSYEQDITDLDGVSNSKADVVEKGSGGITQFSWSNGVRLTDEIAIGLKASYLFSSIVNSYSNTLQESQQPRNFAAVVSERTYVRDFIFSGGLSISRDSLFGRDYRLSFGAVYEFAADVNARHRVTAYKEDPASKQYFVDTLMTAKGFIRLPSGITGGLSLGRKNWLVGAEYAFHDWSSFQGVGEDREALGAAWKAGLGFEITPDTYGQNYLSKITYRTGLSYEKFPYRDEITKNDVKDIGITFGASLPAGSSSVDVAFKYGQRGDSDTYFKEDYFRIYLGLSVNDRWFIKRRFD